MTVWTDDRIPIAVAPLPGEALESWIGAYARRLRITNNEFLSFAGLPASRTRPMALRLLPSEAAALGRSTGIPLPTLISMTLEPYDGFAVCFMPGQRRLGRPVAWRFSGSRNRFCPACLAEQNGRGPVFWRLPWAFACLQHQCLLLDFCPACHRFPNHWKGPPARTERPELVHAQLLAGHHRNQAAVWLSPYRGFRNSDSPATDPSWPPSGISPACSAATGQAARQPWPSSSGSTRWPGASSEACTRSSASHQKSYTPHSLSAAASCPRSRPVRSGTMRTTSRSARSSP